MRRKSISKTQGQKQVVESSEVKAEPIPIPEPKPQKIVAFYWYNLPWHTGARVHDYQLILSLARAGYEIISVTNSIPPFIRDYPTHKNIKWETKHDLDTWIPEKADLVIVSQGPYVIKAINYVKKTAKPLWILAYGPEKWFFDTVKEEIFSDEHILKARYRGANLILTSSEMAKGKFCEWMPDLETKIEILKPYINFAAFPKLPMEKKKAITYCGRLVDYKGYKDFLRWGDEFRKRFCPDLQLNLIATGATDERNRWTIAFNAFDTGFGSFNETEKFKIMASSLAGLLPSQYESFGLVPAEFLALGVPVIAKWTDQLDSEYGNRINLVHSGTDFFNIMKRILAGEVEFSGLGDDKAAELSEARMLKQVKSLITRRLPDWS